MKNLRWHGPILDCSGYASAARGYLRACLAAGIMIQPRDRSRSINLKGRGMDESILQMYESLYNNSVPPNCPLVQHQVADCFYKDLKSSRAIGYTIFEMNSAPKAWVQPCNDMDEIWTGSGFSKAAFLTAGVKVPVKVLPHAIDCNLYSTNAKPWTIANKRSFVFLSVFDFTERKAWRDLLRAYWSAFKKKDDVCLILKVFFGSFNEDSIKDIIRRIHSFRDEIKMEDGAPIMVYGYDIPESKMPGLYRAADCYVGLSREGFGLTYAEAMACGIPCIGPEVGGNREFMEPDNSFLVKYCGDEPVSHETVSMFPKFTGLTWPKHSWEHLAEQMKFVVGNREEPALRAAKGRERVLEKLSPKVVGETIISLLP